MIQPTIRSNRSYQEESLIFLYEDVFAQTQKIVCEGDEIRIQNSLHEGYEY